jgi:hypothetical protein
VRTSSGANAWKSTSGRTNSVLCASRPPNT